MKNTFIVIGAIGLSVTFTIHILLTISNADFTFMFTFYIVWIAFLFIGIGQFIKSKHQNA